MHEHLLTSGGSAAFATGTGAPIAVYIHWPFCLAKCPYCDFNSHVRAGIDQARWRRALVREVDRTIDALPGRRVSSVFFGGGTPSLMAPETVAALIDRIAARWSMDGDAEITLEANPTSVEAGRFAAFRTAGINRVSLGVQALNDADLVFLGRQHGRAEAVAAVDLARRTFPRYSFDLIYARPGQTVAGWRAELAEAVTMAGDHLSVYQLTIERGTPFFAAHRDGAFALPEDELQAALYETTQEHLEGAGLPAYEVSNHAAPGGASRHNLAYWRYGDYVGIGPGAHGRVGIGGAVHATERLRRPEDWLLSVEAQGEGLKASAPLEAPVVFAEILMMGLRLTAGLRHDDLARRTGRTLAEWVSAPRLARLTEARYLAIDDETIRVTAAGRPVLNAILAELLG